MYFTSPRELLTKERVRTLKNVNLGKPQTLFVTWTRTTRAYKQVQMAAF